MNTISVSSFESVVVASVGRRVYLCGCDDAVHNEVETCGYTDWLVCVRSVCYEGKVSTSFNSLKTLDNRHHE